MSFNILYVENDQKVWNAVQEAFQQHRATVPSSRLQITWAETPEEMTSLVGNSLPLQFDVILADVFFDNLKTGKRDSVDRLDDIISFVRQSDKDEHPEKPMPIIAYTGRGQRALDAVLRRKEYLYDVWDKSTASAEYVVWRLSRLAVEMSHSRPDVTMQRLIRNMPTGAAWHDQVVDMAKQYHAGWTERDQVERAGVSIHNIAGLLGVWEVCKPMWQIMIDWEALSRAVSPRVRGHARHVINVFWLGYYLLHHPLLRDGFAKSWDKLKSNRPNMEPVITEEPLEALSNIWFYTGLFHDIAGCVEKSTNVFNWQHELMRPFGKLVPVTSSLSDTPNEDAMDRIDLLLAEFSSNMRGQIKPLVHSGYITKHPDHGFVAAMHLRSHINSGKQGCFAAEAARAMALHNFFPSLDSTAAIGLVSWEQNPIECMLLFCDQLQTWERERGDDTYSSGDGPQRAELADLLVEDREGRPHVKLSINYIAPPHLHQAPVIYKREKHTLEDILRSNPIHALNKITKPWPFSLDVSFLLSGDPLTPVMKMP